MPKISYYISKGFKKLLLLPAVKKSYIHKTSRICSGSYVVNCNISRYSYIGNFCTVLHTDIGSFCSIADNVTIGGAAHPIDWVSSSPVFHQGKNIMKKNFYKHKFKTSAKTVIGSDVWLGAHCMIKSGVTIGNGAIVGMGSIVTGDVPDYAIVAGNPAKIIRMRFDEHVIEKLKKIEWWNLNDEQIGEYAHLFDNPEAFVDAITD